LIRSTIIAQIQEIAAQQKKTLAPLTDSLPLLNSGLDSLCLAVLVASLDDRLDLDPFGADGLNAFPVTLGEFIRLYENAAN
jgi:hypothetical protein